MLSELRYGIGHQAENQLDRLSPMEVISDLTVASACFDPKNSPSGASTVRCPSAVTRIRALARMSSLASTA